MFNKKIDIKLIKQEAFNQGVALGRENQKIMDDNLIQKRALDLYAQQNWLVNPNHVFQVSKTGIPFLNQDPITKEKMRTLQQQAKFLQDSDLWPILTTLIRAKAIDKAVRESTEWNHVLPGKMMVHNIALMESLVKYMAEVDLSTIPDASGKKEGSVV